MIAVALNAGLSPDNNANYIGYIAGFFAIIGHIFPIYYNFKGGKGVLVGVSPPEPRITISAIYCTSFHRLFTGSLK